MSGRPTVELRAAEQDLASLLDDGLFIDGDWIESKDQDPNGEVRLIQLADVGEGVFRDRSSRFLTKNKAKELRCTFLEPGDILVARMPEPLGRACIFPGVGQPAVTAVDVCIVRPNPTRARREWLVKAINSPTFRDSMQEFVRGTTRQRISRKNLGTLRLAVPSVKEQLALADLVDRIQSKRGGAADHVAGARKAIERFRQAVLAAACSGRLTADWREDHDDSAAQLVEKLRSDNASRRKPVSVPDSEILVDLPSSWAPASVDLLIERIEAGKSFTAHGRPAAEGEWGVIKVSSMSWGRFLEGENKAVPKGRQINPDYEIRPGDLLISRANTVDLVGATVLVGETRPRLLLSDKSLRLLPYPAINKAWLNYVLRSGLVRAQFSERATGTSDSMRNLSQGKIRATTLPLPPENEQAEIARRVDQLLTVADVLDQRFELASQCVERSSQAVLAKAFRGELGVNGGSE